MFPKNPALIGYDKDNNNRIGFIMRDPTLLSSLYRARGRVPRVGDFHKGSPLRSLIVPDEDVPDDIFDAPYRLNLSDGVRFERLDGSQ